MRARFVGQEDYRAHCTACEWDGYGRDGCDDGAGNMCPECKGKAIVLTVITREGEDD